MESVGRRREKMFVAVRERHVPLVQAKASFLEETAFEQSSGSVFVSWEEVVT